MTGSAPQVLAFRSRQVVARAVRRPERCAGLLLANAIGHGAWPVALVRLLRRTGAFVERLSAAAMRPALAPLSYLSTLGWYAASTLLAARG